MNKLVFDSQYMLKVYVWKNVTLTENARLTGENYINRIIFACLRTNRHGTCAFCNSLPHYRNLLTRQRWQCHRIIIWCYHLAWMDINGHRICPMQVIVVHHSFRLLQNCLSVSKSGMAESNVDHRTLSGLWKEKSVSARKKRSRIIFQRRSDGECT